MAFRNPSPPPDISSGLEQGAQDDKIIDQVGDTVFSKSWLISVMAKTVADAKHKRQAPIAKISIPREGRLFYHGGSISQKSCFFSYFVH